MFGYIICNRKTLSKEEIDRYQSVYCGLCKVLRERFGQQAGMMLNYDMTFLILFLSSLYEPEEIYEQFRCPVHPVRAKTAVVNRFTEYAADMTLALSYHKCLDDWRDDQNRVKYQMAKQMRESYREVKHRWPKQCERIEESLREVHRVENMREASPDEAVNASGKMLKELFVYQEDFWSNSLRTFGYELGRFIYLMDAAMDYKKDLKSRSYNPLYQMNKTPAEAVDALTMSIGNAAEQFEKLPLVQDEPLLKNILYGGVWQKYHAKVQKKGETHGKRSI